VWLWTILFNGQSGRAYNVGSEDALNIAAVAHEVAAATANKGGVRIASTPQVGAAIHRYVPSTARARQELGLKAEVPLREAIHRTHTWFKAQSTATGAHTEAVRGTYA
jgi:dTDP-glucose 4,6-dehydratase